MSKSEKLLGGGKTQIWRLFAKYHYLSERFNPASRVFVAYANDELAAFSSAIHFMHPRKKNTVREHRTVVFPDFQGVGIGVQFSAAIAEYFKSIGKTYISTTSNPAMIIGRSSDKRWVMTRLNRVSRGSGRMQNKYIKGSTSTARVTAAFEYIGNK